MQTRLLWWLLLDLRLPETHEDVQKRLVWWYDGLLYIWPVNYVMYFSNSNSNREKYQLLSLLPPTSPGGLRDAILHLLTELTLESKIFLQILDWLDWLDLFHRLMDFLHLESTPQSTMMTDRLTYLWIEQNLGMLSHLKILCYWVRSLHS